MGKIILNGTEYAGSGGSGGVIYLPTIYSDEEREVGVWRDGKPLYQKSFYVSNVTVNSWQSITHGISNLENIAKATGEYKRDSDGLSFPVNYYESNSVFIAFQTNNTTIDYKVNGITTGSIFITLQYTKTTDTAGSGSWTPSGAKAVHYSTNEQVIGTWIGGKPLYERTRVVPFANFTHNNDTYFTPIASDNTETLRNVEAIAYSTGYGVCTLGSRAYSRDNTLSYYWELVEYYSNVALHFIGESATDIGVTEVVITYQYTKTTD